MDLCEPPRHRTDAVAATRSRRWPENSTPSSRRSYAATQLRRQHRVDGVGARNLISTQVLARCLAKRRTSSTPGASWGPRHRSAISASRAEAPSAPRCVALSVSRASDAKQQRDASAAASATAPSACSRRRRSRRRRRASASGSSAAARRPSLGVSDGRKGWPRLGGATGRLRLRRLPGRGARARPRDAGSADIRMLPRRAASRARVGERRRRRAGGGRAVQGDRRRVVGRRRDVHARVQQVRGASGRRGAGAASSPSGAASTRP